MTNLKLTKEQIEALRALSAELAEKLESGEAVTLERAVEKWEPDGGRYCVRGDGRVEAYGDLGLYRFNGSSRKTLNQAERLANDQRIFNRLHAYREEFAPGYVVPPAWESVWTPYQDTNGEWSALYHITYRSPTSIYMPEDICKSLCDKLNSGEVVL